MRLALLRRIDRPRRGHPGLRRSRFGCGDGRRVRKLRRDLCGVSAGRAEKRRPEVRCHFGSSVSASCAGSTSRRLHSLPVRTHIHLDLRDRRMRLPASPRAFPLRGLMASRYRGECVSTPHQGRSELHRHPKRVPGCQEFPSFHLGTNPPSLGLGFWSTDRTLARLLVGSTQGSARKHTKLPRSWCRPSACSRR